MADRILITGARAAAALDMARDFNLAGFEVHMADCSASRMARCSTMVAGVHRYPSPVMDAPGFRTAMAALVRRLEPTIIVPTCEETFHLSALDLGPRLFQPPIEILRRMHDKWAFTEHCLSVALPVPETRLIESLAEIELFRRHSHDWVFKRRFSRFGEGTLVGPSSALLDSVGRGWIAQRRVVGQEMSFFATAREGKITAFAGYESRWRMAGGASLSFDAVPTSISETLFGIASALAGSIDLTGQFACDLILDAAGAPWLIECNPRATSGVHLLVGKGRLARAIAEPTESPVRALDGALHLLPALATFGLAQALRQRRLMEWFRQIRSGNDVAGRPGDRKPVLGALIDGFGYSLSGWRYGVSAAAATTRDIEWNGGDLN